MVNNIENTKIGTDIFVVNRFKTSRLIFDNLLKSNLFNSVFYIDIISESEKFKWKCLVSSVARKDYGFKFFTGYPDSEVLYGYDQVFIGDAMPFGLLLCYNNNNPAIFAYDDGLPMYKGNFLTDKSCGWYGFIKRILNIREFSVIPLKYYVNCKSLCHSTVAKEIIQLPKWLKGNKAIEISEQLFMYKEESVIKNNKMIFLEQPLYEMEGYMDKSISHFFHDVAITDKCTIRLHPRSCQNYKKLITSSGDNNWELECINAISDDDILMGCYSMSLFSPKIIADKEPYIIFLFDIFLENLTEEKRSIMINTINEFKTLYQRKDKVLIVASEAELISKLKNITVV